MNTPGNERLEKLEKENRHIRRLSTLGFLLSFFLFGVLVCEMLGFNTITRKALYAESFIVKNSQGQVRAELTSKDNVTMLSLYDRNNLPRLAVSLTNDDPGVHVYDYQGIRRAVFGIGDGIPSMLLMTPTGIQQSGMMLKEDGTTDLFLDQVGGRRYKLAGFDKAHPTSKTKETQPEFNFNSRPGLTY